MISENANALRLAAGAILIFIAAVTVDLRLLYYLAYVLGGVLVAALIWAQLNKRGLQVRRQIQPTNAQVGQVIQEIVEVQNMSWLPKLWLEVRDRSTLPGHHVGAVVSMQGRKSKRWRVRTRCTHRGLFFVGPTVVTTGDPFGLFRAQRVFSQTSELLVYPPTVPLASFGIPEGDLPGGASALRRAHHNTPSAAGLRDYLPGDPMNRIHWPASARLQKLMVKEFELDPSADIWLVLDLNQDVHVACPPGVQGQEVAVKVGSQALRTALGVRGPDEVEPDTFELRLDASTEEYSVTVAASLAAYLISLGRSVGFIAWGQHRVLLPADRGGRQLIKMLRALSVLRAEGETPLSELLVGESRQFNRQDTIIVVTPSLQESWVAALQGHLHKGIRGAAVVVEPSTFCGSGNALMVVSALSSIDVPTYLVKRDDTIDAALGQTYGGTAARNLR